MPPGEEAKSEAKMKSHFPPSDTSVKQALGTSGGHLVEAMWNQLGSLEEAMRKHHGKLAEALPDTRHRPGSFPRRAAALGKRYGITPEAFPDAWKRLGSALESPWKPYGSAPRILEAPPRRVGNVWVLSGS